MQTGTASAPGSTLDRSLSWTGDIVNSIIDNDNPGTTPPFTYGAQSQSLAYSGQRGGSPLPRVITGRCPSPADGVGDRLSETTNGVLSSYAYPTTSNRLSSVATSTSTRAFTYDAAGNILTDSRVGALGMTFQYDVEGRLSKAWQTAAPANGGVYGYDALNRLASRTVTTSGQRDDALCPRHQQSHHRRDQHRRADAARIYLAERSSRRRGGQCEHRFAHGLLRAQRSSGPSRADDGAESELGLGRDLPIPLAMSPTAGPTRR